MNEYRQPEWIEKIYKMIEDAKKKSAKPITNTVKISKEDPQKDERNSYIQGVNRIGELINSLNRDIENRIVAVASIILGGILGGLITAGFYITSLLFAILLFLFLIFTVRREIKQKEKLHLEMKKIVKGAEKIGLDLNQS